MASRSNANRPKGGYDYQPNMNDPFYDKLNSSTYNPETGELEEPTGSMVPSMEPDIDDTDDMEPIIQKPRATEPMDVPMDEPDDMNAYDADAALGVSDDTDVAFDLDDESEY